MRRWLQAWEDCACDIDKTKVELLRIFLFNIAFMGGFWFQFKKVEKDERISWRNQLKYLKYCPFIMIYSPRRKSSNIHSHVF